MAKKKIVQIGYEEVERESVEESVVEPTEAPAEEAHKPGLLERLIHPHASHSEHAHEPDKKVPGKYRKLQ